MHRWEGGRDKKRGMGGMERPLSMPHWVLIQNTQHFIKTWRHLPPKKNKKKKKHYVPHSVFLLLQPQSTRAYFRKKSGCRFVIYYNCSLLKKTQKTLWGFIFTPADVSSDEAWKAARAIKSVGDMSLVSTQLYFSHMNSWGSVTHASTTDCK